MEKKQLIAGECSNCCTRWINLDPIDSDTARCPGCGWIISRALQIEVINALPWKLGKEWVGLNLPARILPGGEIYRVPMGLALKALEKKSPEAAQLFKFNPPQVECLTFIADEVKVIGPCLCAMPISFLPSVW